MNELLNTLTKISGDTAATRAIVERQSDDIKALFSKVEAFDQRLTAIEALKGHLVSWSLGVAALFSTVCTLVGLGVYKISKT